MKAIILTHDRYRALANHVIHKYQELWPDNPFIFRIPYQSGSGSRHRNREYVQTDLPIKSTVLTLIQDLGDEEWVFWCIDDKYPIYLDIRVANDALNWILRTGDPLVDGLLFCRCRKLLGTDHLINNSRFTVGKEQYLERKDYEQIWIHQFLRVKVIRTLFNSFPDEIGSAKDMDTLKKDVEKPSEHRLYVSRKNHAVYGESTTRGLLTQNCYQSLLSNGFVLPEWHSDPPAREKIIGKSTGIYLRSLLRRIRR